MSLYADRVMETSATTGTGTISLGGAVTRYRTFVAGLGSGNQVCYTIEHASADEWEVGIGVETSGSPDTLTRATVISSSNSGSLVNFSAGDKNVFCTVPARDFGQYPLSPPPAPSVYDDEFTTGSLDAKWTTLSTPDGAFVVTPNKHGSWLSFAGPGHASDNQQNWRQALGATGDAGTAITVIARLGVSTIGSLGSNHPSASLILSEGSDPSTGSRLQMFVGSNGAQFKVAVYDDASGDFSGDIGALNGTVLMMLHRTAGNVVSVFFSLDGFTWRKVWTDTKTYDFGYLTLRGISGPNGSSPSDSLFDFVRVNDARFILPVP